MDIHKAVLHYVSNCACAMYKTVWTVYHMCRKWNAFQSCALFGVIVIHASGWKLYHTFHTDTAVHQCVNAYVDSHHTCAETFSHKQCRYGSFLCCELPHVSSDGFEFENDLHSLGICKVFLQNVSTCAISNNVHYEILSCKLNTRDCNWNAFQWGALFGVIVIHASGCKLYHMFHSDKAVHQCANAYVDSHHTCAETFSHKHCRHGSFVCCELPHVSSDGFQFETDLHTLGICKVFLQNVSACAISNDVHCEILSCKLNTRDCNCLKSHCGSTCGLLKPCIYRHTQDIVEARSCAKAHAFCARASTEISCHKSYSCMAFLHCELYACGLQELFDVYTLCHIVCTDVFCHHLDCVTFPVFHQAHFPYCQFQTSLDLYQVQSSDGCLQQCHVCLAPHSH